MNGRPIARFACDCHDCRVRLEAEWERFVEGHQDVADRLRDVFLNPEGITPVRRLQEYLAATREAGETTFEDGA